VSLQYVAVPAQPWPALEACWLPRLPAARRAHLLRLRHATDRNASILGTALLAAVLDAEGCRFDAGLLAFPPQGKPFLTEGPDFSVSHTDGLVAVAVAATGRVGLDLERDGAVGEATIARLADAALGARLARGELSPTDAFVMKEAVAKRAGFGIGALGRVLLEADGARLDGERVALTRVVVAPGHVAWLAHAPGSVRLAVRERRPAEFAPLPAGP
jgi:phosphopantetheinyl transferase